MSSIRLFSHAKRNGLRARAKSSPAREDHPFLMHGDLSAIRDDAVYGDAHLKAAKNLLATPAQAELRAQIIKRHSDEFAISGNLVKYATRGPLGLLGEVMHNRWFKLNPVNATLSYWVPGCCCGPPRRAYRLQQLEAVDTNEFHNRIFLKFQGRPLLRLKAASAEEFGRWMQMIHLYVQTPEALDASNVKLDLPDEGAMRPQKSEVFPRQHPRQLTEQQRSDLLQIIVRCPTEGGATTAEVAPKPTVPPTQALAAPPSDPQSVSAQEETTQRLKQLGYNYVPPTAEATAAQATATNQSISGFTFSKKHAEDDHKMRRPKESTSIASKVKSYITSGKRGGC